MKEMKLNVNLVNNRVVWLCLSSRVSGLIRQFYCNDPPWNKAFLQTCTICMVESKITFQVSFLCPFHIQKSQDPNFPKAFHNCIIVIWAIVLLKQASLNFSHLLGSLSHSAPLSLSALVGGEGC